MNCPICLDKVSGKIWKCIECGNEYHVKCLNEALKIRPSCPSCNRELIDKDFELILSKAGFKRWIRDRVHMASDAMINEELFPYIQIVELTKKCQSEVNRLRKMGVVVDMRLFVESYKLYRSHSENGFRDIHPSILESIVNSFNLYQPEPFSYMFRYEDFQRDIVPKCPLLIFLETLSIGQIRSWIDHTRIKDSNKLYIDYTDEIGDIEFRGGNFNIFDTTNEFTTIKGKTFNVCECGGTIIVIQKHRGRCVKCSKAYCTKCGAEITDETTHECKSEDIESMKTIKLNSRACPKCGVRIQRSEGCPQMFCTICHTGFDYNDGSIITSNFHNPHRMEWLNSIHDQIPIHECGEFDRERLRLLRTESRFISYCVNLINHINDYFTRDVISEYRNKCISKYLKQMIKGKFTKAIFSEFGTYRILLNDYVPKVTSLAEVIGDIIRGDGDTKNKEELIMNVIIEFLRETRRIYNTYNKNTVYFFFERIRSAIGSVVVRQEYNLFPKYHSMISVSLHYDEE